VYQRFYGVLWIFEALWHTWENEILGVSEGLRGSSGFLKISGIFMRMRFWVCQRVNGVLWILESPLVHLGE